MLAEIKIFLVEERENRRTVRDLAAVSTKREAQMCNDSSIRGPGTTGKKADIVL